MGHHGAINLHAYIGSCCSALALSRSYMCQSDGVFGIEFRKTTRESRPQFAKVESGEGQRERNKTWISRVASDLNPSGQAQKRISRS